MMTEFQSWQQSRVEAKKSRRFLLLYVLACLTAVTLSWYIFERGTEPTEDQIEQFHERRDQEIGG